MRGFLRGVGWLSVLVVSLNVGGATNGLVAHEWGTFTALQDESGRCLDGINTDDEPVPQFVHQLARASFVATSSEVPGFLFQGAPYAHPNVTMRLETPVIYFHPADNAPLKVEVKVSYRGGLLTEYYPQPTRAEPAVDFTQRKTAIHGAVTGLLEWKDLEVGSGGAGPVTEDPVWVAPRRVKASDVKTTTGESERFLFYRGLGTGEALLSVARQNGELVIRSSASAEIKTDLRIPRLWLVDIQKGQVAVRAVDGFTIRNGEKGVLRTIPATFETVNYSPANALKLRRALLAALMEEGLFEDEAVALLETWKISYFQSPGLRLFFIVPREWTDHVLPLEIPQAEKITRVMVGRIELVSPQQRQLLARINKATPAEIQAAAKEMHSRIMKKFYPPNARLTPETMAKIDLVYKGRRSLAEAGVEAVPIYKTYLELGRFRHTLVKNSMTNAPGLTAFAEAFRL